LKKKRTKRKEGGNVEESTIEEKEGEEETERQRDRERERGRGEKEGTRRYLGVACYYEGG